ncbi:MAG: OB-fold nucleic acid binding domain-containing protein [Candidatus Aenigmatarchaeota archaeon]
MVIERMTAKKVRISDIMSGRWVKKEGMEPSFVVTNYGDKVSRARILSTIVAKFISEDGNFASITLDDGTETIRAKTFKTIKPIEGLDVGIVVDVIGKVKEYNGEVYIIPEIIKRIEDPNQETLRLLEIKKNLRGKDELEQPEEQEEDRDKLRKDILTVVVSSKDGASYDDIMNKIKGDSEQIESVINELLAEGICYEPTPGKIRKI